MSSFGLPWRPRTMKSARGKEVTTTMPDEKAFQLNFLGVVWRAPR